jgi:nitronate monooxygenase
MLNSPAAVSTSLTKAFSGRYARGITNQLIRDMKSKEQEIGSFPLQYWLTGIFRREAAKQEQQEMLSLWAGQAAHYAHTQTAEECFKELVEEVEQVSASN